MEAPPWDFSEIVADVCRSADSLLDLGTGGGEWLSALPRRPARTVATEAWAPNVAIARRRLESLGVEVVQVESARDNVKQRADERSGRLPFPDGTFDVVVSRHETYAPAEVARVLAPGGRFVTQQLSPGSSGFAKVLGISDAGEPIFRLELARTQLEAAGLAVIESAEGERLLEFGDVGALAWYLKAVPWTVAGFDVPAFRAELQRLHEAGEQLRVSLYSFWLSAV